MGGVVQVKHQEGEGEHPQHVSGLAVASLVHDDWVMHSAAPMWSDMT